MREDRIKYADSLIDAVVQIEDKYIYEAQSYAPKKRLPAYVKGAIGLAASLLIVISAFVPLYLFSEVRGGARSSKGEHMTLQAKMYSALINSTAAVLSGNSKATALKKTGIISMAGISRMNITGPTSPSTASRRPTRNAAWRASPASPSPLPPRR